MERNALMETAKRQSYYWWFDSHSNSHGRSQWLQSSLSELDERTKSMLKIIEEDADSFAQRAEMYYEKRPQLIILVEDFYRIHRSLAIQFDHLRHDPTTRKTSPLIRSFSLSTVESEKKAIDPRKSHDYSDSDESIDSEVDDPMMMPEVNHDLMLVEIDRLKEEAMVQKRKLMEKEKAMEELKWELDEAHNEVTKLKEDAEEKETMRMNVLEEKDEEKREVIRQLSVAIETLKSENLVLKKLFVNQRAKKWNPFEGFRKIFSVVSL